MVETLKTTGLRTRVQPKIVYAENINMAGQYGTAGNAGAVFTAYSPVRQDRAKVIPVPEKTRQPVSRARAIIAGFKASGRSQAVCRLPADGQRTRNPRRW